MRDDLQALPVSKADAIVYGFTDDLADKLSDLASHVVRPDYSGLHFEIAKANSIARIRCEGCSPFDAPAMITVTATYDRREDVQVECERMAIVEDEVWYRMGVE